MTCGIKREIHIVLYQTPSPPPKKNGRSMKSYPTHSHASPHLRASFVICIHNVQHLNIISWGMILPQKWFQTYCIHFHMNVSYHYGKEWNWFLPTYPLPLPLQPISFCVTHAWFIKKKKELMEIWLYAK